MNFTMTTTTTARRATSDDVADVAETLSLGFRADPWARWLFPHDETYAEYSTRYFTFWTELAVQNSGLVWLVDGLGALVCFAEEDLHKIKSAPDWDELIAEVTGPYADRARAWDAASDANHPQLPAHIYGAYGAVRPGHQNKGIGRAIYSACYEYADSRGLGYYGESTSAHNFRLYARLGATGVGKRFYLPGDEHARAAELIPHWCEPQS